MSKLQNLGQALETDDKPEYDGGLIDGDYQHLPINIRTLQELAVNLEEGIGALKGHIGRSLSLDYEHIPENIRTLQKQIDYAIANVPSYRLDILVRDLIAAAKHPITLEVKPNLVRERLLEGIRNARVFEYSKSTLFAHKFKERALNMVRLHLIGSDELDYSKERLVVEDERGEHSHTEFTLIKYNARLMVELLPDYKWPEHIFIRPLWTRKSGKYTRIDSINPPIQTVNFCLSLSGLEKGDLSGLEKGLQNAELKLVEVFKDLSAYVEKYKRTPSFFEAGKYRVGMTGI